jgi:hypothetical protein
MTQYEKKFGKEFVMELKTIIGIALVVFIVGASVWLHIRKKNKE